MPTVTIKPVRVAKRGHNRFCGPAALSIITGIDTAEAAAVIRHTSRRRNVQGTSNWEMIRALQLLGFRAVSAAKVNPLKPKTNPTLAAWLKSEERDGKSLYLIAAAHHWQVVQGRRYCCGLTKDIVSIRDEKVKRRGRVTGVWRIEHDRKVALADVLPKTPKAKRDPLGPEVHRLCREHEIELEVTREDGYTRITVWGPAWAAGADEEAHDPFYGDHEAEDWADALARVQAYIRLKQERPDLFIA